jgi:hypothetical protein
VRLEGLSQLKYPMTSTGIEPRTFRLAAQHEKIKDEKTAY